MINVMTNFLPQMSGFVGGKKDNSVLLVSCNFSNVSFNQPKYRLKCAELLHDFNKDKA